MSEKQTKRTIKREIIQSQWFHESREVLVYLPPGYNENQLFPCLILHDGPDYFHLGRIVTQAQSMIHEHKLIPFVMIALPINKTKRNDEYSPVGNCFRTHQQFIMNEVLPYLSDRYAVDLSSSGLVIGGSSLGGTASLHLALTNPNRITKVLSQSGAFLETTTEQIIQNDSLQEFSIYLSVGKEETKVKTHLGSLDLVTRNREIYRHLQEKQARVSYREKEGDHTWGFWQRDLPEALAFFFGVK
jgi:enterochelin esterase-like enzyme